MHLASHQTSPHIPKIAPHEWRFVIALIVGLLLFTSIPYAFAYFTAPADKQFMGFMLDVPDHGQYFSWYREFQTAWLSSNKLTPEPNQPIFFNLLWFVFARVGAALNVNYHIMYQVLRVVGTAAFLWVAYRLCAWFLESVEQRRAALLIIALSAGFGWVLVAIKYLLRLPDVPLPLTLYVAESNTFHGILGYPHFVAAMLYIFSFELVLRAQATGQIRYAIYAGLWAQFLGWQHAYDLVLVWGILGAYVVALAARNLFSRKRFMAAIPWRMVINLIIIGLISCPPALYSVVLTRLDPVWKEVLAQFANAGVYTPNPLQLPILLGPAFLVAAFATGAMLIKRQLNWADHWLFALAWFISNFPLAYVPTDFQIHMLNGWQVPAALLAVFGIYNFGASASARGALQPANNAAQQSARSALATSRRLLVVLLITLLPTNLYLWAWRFIDLRRYDYPYYLHRNDMDAMQWLAHQPDRDAVVLSSLTAGQYLPMFTGQPAYLAHWAQTLRFFEKRDQVAAFFDGATDDARRIAILKNHNVKYVFYGPAERALGAYNPASASFLQASFQTPQVQIFAVRAEVYATQ